MNPKIERVSEQAFGDFASDMFQETEADVRKEPYFPSPDGQLRPAKAAFQPSLKGLSTLPLEPSSSARGLPQPGSWVSSLLQQRKDRPS